jgi:hypothetical protein
MKIRLTNSTEIDPATITSVLRSEGTYAVRFANGQGAKYRSVQLTTEGRQLLDEHLSR